MEIPIAGYRSALKIFIIFVTLSLFVFPSPASSSQENTAELDRLANAFFELAGNKKFKEATELFHYPAEYTPQKLEEDKIGLRTTLEYVQGKFGAVSSHQPFEQEVETFNFSLNSGNPSYWDKHSGYVSKRYKVVFDASGDGFVSFVFCRIQDKWEIRTIKYEKQASEEARKFILDVIDTFRAEIVPRLHPELYQPKIQSIQPNI